MIYQYTDILLRTSAIQASLIALGLSSALYAPRCVQLTTHNSQLFSWLRSICSPWGLGAKISRMER